MFVCLVAWHFSECQFFSFARCGSCQGSRATYILLRRDVGRASLLKKLCEPGRKASPKSSTGSVTAAPLYDGICSLKKLRTHVKSKEK